MSLETPPPKGGAFFWNLLRVLNRSDMLNSRTVEQITEKYNTVHPRNWVRKMLSPSISSEKVSRTLNLLYKHELVSRELVRFLDGEPLDKDIPVYHISKKGSYELQQKKNKS